MPKGTAVAFRKIAAATRVRLREMAPTGEDAGFDLPARSSATCRVFPGRGRHDPAACVAQARCSGLSPYSHPLYTRFNPC